MRFVVAGGTGFIGASVAQALTDIGHEVIIPTRFLNQSRQPVSKNARFIKWSEELSGSDFSSALDGCDGVINLIGEPIFSGWWTQAKKSGILHSRVQATQKMVSSIAKAIRRPKVLINASAIGYYGSRGDEILTEKSGFGNGFLSEVCRAWEAEASQAENLGVRTVRLRIGLVLGKAGGILQKVAPAFKVGLGAWFGGGSQWMSWIHLEDLTRMILFCLQDERLGGAVNAVSPEPVSNKDFSLSLAEALRRPCFLSVPALILESLLGEMSQMFLASQRAVPKSAIDLGFSFRHTPLRSAFQSIFS